MTAFTIHPEANAEAVSAAEWYHEQAGLGQEFLVAVASTIRLLCVDPSSHELVCPGLRRRRVHSFPYDVVFEDRPKLIRIIAVAHHHRRPEYWRGRQADD